MLRMRMARICAEIGGGSSWESVCLVRGRRYVVYSTAFAKRANAVSEFDSARVRRRRERKMLVFGKFD